MPRSSLSIAPTVSDVRPMSLDSPLLHRTSQLLRLLRIFRLLNVPSLMQKLGHNQKNYMEVLEDRMTLQRSVWVVLYSSSRRCCVR